MRPRKVAVPDVKEPRVWIFQANPKFYRILEALQHLDRMQFLTSRYKDRIKAHPGHLQNRGEKPYRVRLSQFLAALHGGQA